MVYCIIEHFLACSKRVISIFSRQYHLQESTNCGSKLLKALTFLVAEIFLYISLRATFPVLGSLKDTLVSNVCALSDM